MLRKLNLLLASVLLTVTCAFAQTGLGTLKGSVRDKDTKEMLPYVKVILKQNGTVKGGSETDFDGKFQINSVAPGTYSVEFRDSERQPKSIEGVVISSDRITFLDNTEVGKSSDVLDIEEVEVVAYKVPLINKDGGAAGATITREDIAKLPVRSAAGVAGTVGGVATNEGSGAISVRGSREDATYFYIDGIKVRGSASLPKSAIQEVSVITGGLPANYGDATGGIISVTTRGPSSRYFGSLEAVTSGFYFNGSDPLGYDGTVIGLDQYGYNLVEGLLSGPLLMRKDSTGAKTEPILGFLLSVNYTDVLDGRPLANGGGYRIKKDVRQELLDNPLRPSSTGAGTFHNANFLSADDFEQNKWRMNARSRSLSAAAKIDVNTGPSVNLTFGGSANFNKGKAYSYAGSLLNFENFGDTKSFDWRVYGRFTQRFINNQEGSSSKVKSAFYSLMVDFSKSYSSAFDEDHEFNAFNYGHVGTFTTSRRPSYEFTDGGDSLVHNGFEDFLVEFTPSELNPTLAAITSQYYEIYEDSPNGRFNNLNQIQNGNALRNGDTPESVYSLWNNIGTPYNYFGKFESDQFRVTGSGSVNIGDHSLSLGFEYEQRFDRGWQTSVGPISLWTVARQYANFHITELDKNQATFDYYGTFPRITYERLNTGYAYNSGTGEYGGQVNSDEQYFFDYNLREKLGLDVAGTDFIDIDAYDPNTFQLDMFSPDELFNSGSNFIQYWGYDHTGKKVRGNTDIDKYFTEFDENGNYKRFIGAYQPIYIAGYIMDKFAFDDIVFNVGLRVDVFDANQPVLKDKYLVYNARSVAEARSTASSDPSTFSWVDIPTSMEDDYVVYVNDVNNPTAINGFRNGDTWYDANGVETEDPKTLRGPAGIAPWLLNPGQTTPSSDAFEDYKPQVSIMPRIAFSFPISDEASFFANYDILTKRPTSGVRFDPIDFQFIEQRSGSILANSGLAPEKTIDYAIGFQQVLTRTSSLKINAFYREQRNNVTLRNVFEAYPATYITYGNRDFGTVKGMTVSYDLRRTGNIRMTANYTLQFADGTGSSSGSAINVVSAGQPNLRTIFPYDFDQRHAFAITMDYRYGSGSDYRGPRIGDKNILENTGLNVVTNINSGSPYSAQNQVNNSVSFTPQTATLDGSLNGSRKPWTYRLDLQLDRTFDLEFGKDDNKKKNAFLNVYLRVTNILNSQNVINVYRATGNPTDDGYLADAESQSVIQNQLNEQSFRDYYGLKVNNPFNVSAPRTIRLGVKIDF